MKDRPIDKLIGILTANNRPIRIFFFGGALIAYVIMRLLGKLLGVDTNISGDDIDLLSVLLIIASILTGYGISYSILQFLENAKSRQEDEGDQG